MVWYLVKLINVDESPRVLAIATATFVTAYFRTVTMIVVLYACTMAAMLFNKMRAALRRTPAAPPLHCVPKRGPQQVRVCTYNIFARPPLIHNNANDYKNERLAVFEKELDRFDVICLQEMFALGSARQKRLRAAAHRAGFVHQVTGAWPPIFSLKFIDAGLVVLSRYPILESDTLMYSKGFQIDGWAAKQVLFAKIQVSTDPGGVLHLFTTHLQASYNTNSHHINAFNDSARLAQVGELAGFVRRKLANVPPAERGAVFVAGDFNVDARGRPDEYCEMVEIMRSNGFGVKNLHPEHPVTYGDATVGPDGSVRSRDTVLTAVEDHAVQMCLDYMFLLHPAPSDSMADSMIATEEAARATTATAAATATAAVSALSASAVAEATRSPRMYAKESEQTTELALRGVASEPAVEPFFVRPEQHGVHPFGQMSDHYGLSCTLTVPTPAFRL